MATRKKATTAQEPPITAPVVFPKERVLTFKRYSKGAKVSHNSKHWVSTADANVWEPGVYGWEESA